MYEEIVKISIKYTLVFLFLASKDNKSPWKLLNDLINDPNKPINSFKKKPKTQIETHY